MVGDHMKIEEISKEYKTEIKNKSSWAKLWSLLTSKNQKIKEIVWSEK